MKVPVKWSRLVAGYVAVAALLLAGCGGDDDSASDAQSSASAPASATSTPEPEPDPEPTTPDPDPEPEATPEPETEPEAAADTGEADRIAAAENVIDAFYSYDADVLAAALGDVRDADFVLYYQGWAEGGNYEVLNRMPCEATSSTAVSCSITVRDDFAQTLELDFDVTDTFTFIFDAEGAIASVTTSSDDPPLVREAFSWVTANKPELADGVCEGLFQDGPTPGDCARAVTEAFAEFAALQE